MKKLLALLLTLIMTFALAACGDTSDTTTSDTEADQTEVQEEIGEESEEKDPTADMTMEQKNAYKAAKSYLEFSGFSKQGLIDQLSSEYADNYPEDVAEFAVNALEENGEVDWVEECKESAQSYLEFSSFSKEGLIEQLTSEYGDKYTREEAEAAVEEVYK